MAVGLQQAGQRKTNTESPCPHVAFPSPRKSSAGVNSGYRLQQTGPGRELGLVMWRHSEVPEVWLGPQLRMCGAQALCISPIIKKQKGCVLGVCVQLPPKHAIIPVLIESAAYDWQQCPGHTSGTPTSGFVGEHRRKWG